MKRITISQLNRFGACENGVSAFADKFKKSADAKAVFYALIKAEKLDWANWLVARLLSKKDRIRYAVYAAEQVFEIYEKEHSNDDRPRKAIEAAKAVLKKNNVKTRAYAADAANAANAAANAANAADAANAAANAADAAANAAYAACAADAAYAACAAAYAAADAAMKLKIIRHGIRLLSREGK